ncbi:MAG: HD domain-containing protein, partial [bacterium]|nr:HD domain-containing protein [bacterium]
LMPKKENKSVMETLLQFSAILNSTLQEENIFAMVMDMSKNLLGAEASSLFAISPNGKELYAKTARGKKGELIQGTALKFGEGIAGWVAKFGKPLLVPNVAKSKYFNPSFDSKSGFITKSIICVPLRTKDKLIGCLEVINKQNGKEFTQQDQSLLSALADQIAIALQNARLYEELKQSYLATVQTLIGAIEAKDPYTKGHSQRVSEYAAETAVQMKLPETTVEAIRIAGLLHDIGKIGISESVLWKPDALTDGERAMIEQHPTIGAKILCGASFLVDKLDMIRYHQERYDGKGYPEGIKKNKIPLGARIIAICDTFDALTSTRPYRRSKSGDEAVQIILSESGAQFDPKVTKAFEKACTTAIRDKVKEKQTALAPVG